MQVLLQVKDLSKRHGATVILENATTSFSSGERIGVIGRNGAGKSTLCRIITGDEEKDSGEVIMNRNLRLGYLEQHDPYKPEEIVSDFLTRYTGREEWQCGKVADQFHLTQDHMFATIGSLAGGYQTRVKLAAMMLRDPNFLILDEPSNYLDLSTLILLENFLHGFKGGYLVVSHDREFLKRTCNQTLEVEHGDLALYPGTVEDYFEFKEEQMRQKMAFNKGVEKKKAQLQNFVDRFGAKASKATQAKSKMKQIQKLETIEIAHTLGNVRIKIPEVERKGGIALRVDDLDIGYPTKTVASNVTAEIERGSRVAILGDNGQGKTTFMKTVASSLDPIKGSFKWGAGLKIAYYAQHVFATLDPRMTVLQHLQSEAVEGVGQQAILDIAGSFLFQGDAVKKKVGVLSGGERARVCLAGLLLTKSQVLLLDEPTNHLDFETVEALGAALRGYGGTVFFISHDRTFVNEVATTILDVKDGKIVRYPGNYEDYVYHLECQARNEEPDEEVVRELNAHTRKHDWASGDLEEEDSVSPANVNSEEKEKRSQIQKIKAKLKKADSKLLKYKQEVSSLEQERERNPFHFSQKRKDHLKSIIILIEDREAEIKQLKSKLKKLQA